MATWPKVDTWIAIIGSDLKFSFSNDSKEGNCGFEEKLKDKRKLKHSLLRVGSDKYLANFKTQKGQNQKVSVNFSYLLN